LEEGKCLSKQNRGQVERRVQVLDGRDPHKHKFGGRKSTKLR
jgi:hypothetical protein